jgi:hypothetical protein
MTLLSTHNSLCVFVCVQGFESENSSKGNQRSLKWASFGLLHDFVDFKKVLCIINK